MHTYTIVGFYRDNDQPFTWPVSITTASPEAAAAIAVREILTANEWDEDQSYDVRIVAILEHPAEVELVDMSGLNEVAPGADFLQDGPRDPDRLKAEQAEPEDVLAEIAPAR